MAASTKKTPKRKAPVRKLLLASPFTPTWPTLDEGREEALLKAFLALKQSWTPEDARKTRVVVGLNAVTRALEKRQVSGVLLSVAADPPKLIHGVIQLCYTTDTPVACVRRIERFVAGLTGASSTLALALRSSEDSPCAQAFVRELAGRPRAVVEEKNQRQESTCKRQKVSKPVCPDVSEVYLPRNMEVEKKFADRIALVDGNALGFPSYEPLVELVVRSDVDQPQKAKETLHTPKSSTGYIGANVKCVFSSGRKTKASKSKCPPGKKDAPRGATGS